MNRDPQPGAAGRQQQPAGAPQAGPFSMCPQPEGGHPQPGAAGPAAGGVWMTLPGLADAAPRPVFRWEGEPPVQPAPQPPQNLHLLIRCPLALPPRPGGWVLRLCADDFYEAFLDGGWLGQGPAPGREGTAWYQEYPLPGGRRMLLAVHLHYLGLVNRVTLSGDGRCGVWASLVPAGAGAPGVLGNTPGQKVTPDPQQQTGAPGNTPGRAGRTAPAAPGLGPWRYQICRAYTGKPTGYDTQFTEDFDNRLWPEGWEQPGFEDAGWPALCAARWPEQTEPRLLPQPTPPLWRGRVEPSACRAVPGGLQFDFGRERTGAVHLAALGRAGQQLILRYGEELDETGRVLSPMRCGCDYEDRWTLAEGRSLLHPFAYKGFRYLEVLGLAPGGGPAGAEFTGLDAPAPDAAPPKGSAPNPPNAQLPALAECWLWERHYPLPENACTLRCAAGELEDIFTLCKNAVRCGCQESYLDCPTREKGQYLGDAVITARAQLWLSGDTALLRKCIGDFAATAPITPGLLAVAPGGLRQAVADYSLLFAALPLTDYDFTDDAAFLQSCWPAVCGVVDHYARYCRADGLLQNVVCSWNMVDWPESARDGYDFALTRPAVAPGCHNVINALWVGALRMQAKMARILGLDAPRAGLERRAANAFCAVFYRPQQRLFADSEQSGHCSIHANAFAACFGLTRPEDAEAYAALLFAPGRYCGPWAAYFALRGLARLGRYREVWQFITRPDAHGWRNMLRQGATACFEAFGKEQKWNTSLCHPWAAGALPVLVEELAGLHPDPGAPGGLAFAPQLPEGLGGFCLTVPFKGGTLRVEKPAPGQTARLVRGPAQPL